MFSEFCSISALSCSFEFVWWWWWYSQRLLCLNPTTVKVVLLLGLWLLLGCDNMAIAMSLFSFFQFLGEIFEPCNWPCNCNCPGTGVTFFEVLRSYRLTYLTYMAIFENCITHYASWIISLIWHILHDA